MKEPFDVLRAIGDHVDQDGRSRLGEPGPERIQIGAVRGEAAGGRRCAPTAATLDGGHVHAGIE